MVLQVILSLALIAGTSLQRIWETHSLEGAEITGALCNDGSSPLYYQSLQPNSRDWLLFLPGGAGCYDQNSCDDRLKIDPALTSSRYEKKQFHNASGIFSDNCRLNPAFCNANVIFLSYCSSDWWSGDSEFEMNTSSYKGQFLFRGHRILTEVLHQLFNRTPLKQASRFIIGGNSAGGLGALINADRLGQILKAQIGDDLIYKVLVDSSVFLRGPVYADLPCTQTFLCGIQTSFYRGYHLWNNKFDAQCQKRYPRAPWECFYVDTLLPFVSTPTMILMHKYDIWQWWSDGLNTDIELSRKQPEEVAYMESRGNQLMYFLRSAYFMGKVDAVFMTSCIFHSTLQFKEEYLEYEVEGQTAAQVVHEWVEKGRRQFITENCNGMNCSPQCSAPNMMIKKHIASFPPRYSLPQ